MSLTNADMRVLGMCLMHGLLSLASYIVWRVVWMNGATVACAAYRPFLWIGLVWALVSYVVLAVGQSKLWPANITHRRGVTVFLFTFTSYLTYAVMNTALCFNQGAAYYRRCIQWEATPAVTITTLITILMLVTQLCCAAEFIVRPRMTGTALVDTTKDEEA
jgi:hypothetical protein